MKMTNYFAQSDKSQSVNIFSVSVYHGSYCVVNNPKLKKGKYTKDFGDGFYVTLSEQQAVKFTKKFKDRRVVNIYTLCCDNPNDLRIKSFSKMSDEWLDFIAQCRAGIKHNYDIVEGPMADDQVWVEAQNYLDGLISKTVFWELCKFVYPTHQICLCTDKAIDSLKFVESYEVV